MKEEDKGKDKSWSSQLHVGLSEWVHPMFGISSYRCLAQIKILKIEPWLNQSISRVGGSIGSETRSIETNLFLILHRLIQIKIF